MHDVNLLGPMMHLRELERQAQAAHWIQQLRRRNQDGSRFAAVGSSMTAFLQQLRTVRLFWRVVRRAS